MRKVKLALLILMCMAIVISSCITAFAEGGENSTSEGIPGQKPLSFVSIILEDGSKIDVPGGITTEPKFKLTFDKNVVNMLIWGNNSKCFSLTTANGENVPISVTKIDDTIDFSKRQVIFVQPVSQLKAGTTYYLKISPDLLAKNGSSTLAGTTSGKGVTITFKTKGQAAVQSTADNASSTVQKSSEDYVNTTSSTTSAKDSATSNSSTSASNNAEESTQTNAVSDTNQVQEQTDTETEDSSVENAPAENVPAESENNQETASSQENKIVKMISDNWMAESVILLIIAWVAIEIVIRKKRGIKNNQ